MIDEEKREKQKEYQKRYRENNREKKRQSGRDWYRKQGLEKKRELSLKKWYGIGLDEYSILLEQQNNVCAICGQNRNYKHKGGTEWSLSVDHNHDTGKIRGLLCSKCNTGLGMFDDNIELLINAVIYMKERDL